MIVAAILHDVVEDTECSVETIKDAFNERISEMVDKLTRDRIDNGEKLKLTLEEVVQNLGDSEDYETLFVKVVDRIHNLETIDGLKQEKQEKMGAETIDNLIGLISIIADKLNIYGKFHLENRIVKLSSDIAKKFVKH
ncbi:MAG: (p)ppGpp synthase/HD superfamily hydrolase [Candidatus Midichloriaceae bacterium]